MILDHTEIGIIADTHGIVRSSVRQALSGVSHIIHAGDIDKPEVLEELRQIAPITAVTGNMDKGGWAKALPVTELVEVGDSLLYILHNIDQLAIDPKVAGFAAVISGHSHRPSIVQKNGVFYINPGSAGPSRFSLPVTLIRLSISKSSISPRILNLEPGNA